MHLELLVIHTVQGTKGCCLWNHRGLKLHQSQEYLYNIVDHHICLQICIIFDLFQKFIFVQQMLAQQLTDSNCHHMFFELLWLQHALENNTLLQKLFGVQNWVSNICHSSWFITLCSPRIFTIGLKIYILFSYQQTVTSCYWSRWTFLRQMKFCLHQCNCCCCFCNTHICVMVILFARGSKGFRIVIISKRRWHFLEVKKTRNLSWGNFWCWCDSTIVIVLLSFGMET